jgi:hypothetical protein
MNRLARYRELMRTLDPQGDPRAALTSGWCVGEGPRAAFAKKIARRLELEPSSQHLVLGGIGSGKTTELWRIHAELEASAEETGTRCEYLDVSTVHRLDRMKPGVLVALVGKRLIERAPASHERSEQVASAVQRIDELADGHEDDDYPEGYPGNYVPGVVEPHELGPVQGHAAHLRALTHGSRFTFLIDSLDRMPTSSFEEAVREDLDALRLAGIGVVLVGPMRLRYGSQRAITELFGANVHSLPEIEPVDEGLAFLTQALRQRVPLVAQQLARGSGGVMRDLIALAKGAAQEAYVDGSAGVLSAHVATAIDQHGRVSAAGLDSEQVGALRLIREKGTMVIRDERDIALLERRRVLDYGGGRFVVHPALAPLLDFMQAAA